MSVASVLALAACVRAVVIGVHARRDGAEWVSEPDRLPVKCWETLGRHVENRRRWETTALENQVWQRVGEWRGGFHPGSR